MDVRQLVDYISNHVNTIATYSIKVAVIASVNLAAPFK